MEKLKIGINFVIAISLIAIAVILISQSISEKSYGYRSYDINGNKIYIGVYLTLESCIKDEMLFNEIYNRTISPENTTCTYQ